MTNMQDVDLVDFAGSLAHIVAGNAYILVGLEKGAEGLEASGWYGGASGADVVTDITALARYAISNRAEGPRLMLWASIEGIAGDSPLIERRVAYDLFASVATITHDHLSDVAKQLAEMAAGVSETQAQPVPIADTIFEPVGSIGDMEPHQAEFMRLQAEAASRPGVEAVVDEPDGISAGNHEDSDEPRPEAISAGMMEDGHAQTDGEAGQDAGGTAAADPQAQGSVSGLSDAGDAVAASSEDDEAVEAYAGEGAPELGAPLAEPQGAASEALDPVTTGTVVTDKPRRKTSK